jgi:DNA-binding CsgD family transcriptional regulator
VSTPRRGQPLGPREEEVLNRVARGASYRQIGRDLGISENTSRGYGTSAITKLGAESMAHAVHLAHCAGLIGMYPDCGDRAAFLRHWRRGEIADIKCRRANADNAARQRAASTGPQESVDVSGAPGPRPSAAGASGAPQAHGNAHPNPNATKEIH